MEGEAPSANYSGKAAPRRKKGGPNRGTWIVVAIAAAVLIAFIAAGGAETLANLDPALLWKKLVKPLSRTLVFLAVGLLIGQIIEGSGISTRLGAIAGPITRTAHLPPQAGTAFATAFASGIAANALLYTSWREGKFDRRQLVLSNLLNASLPAYFLHLPTTFFVVYAMLGRAALVYFALTLCAALLRCAGVLVVGRLWLAPQGGSLGAEKGERKSWPEVWRDSLAKFKTRFRRLLLIILPVYLMVFLLAQSGFFGWLGNALAGWVTAKAFPVEAMSVIAVSVMAEFTSGFAAAAALLEAGSLTLKQVVVALLVGNMVATPFRVIRHQLPHYMGIYSPRLGGFLLTVGQTTRIASVLTVTIGYVWLG
jgi:hypothetical protein